MSPSQVPALRIAFALPPMRCALFTGSAGWADGTCAHSVLLLKSAARRRQYPRLKRDDTQPPRTTRKIRDTPLCVLVCSAQHGFEQVQPPRALRDTTPGPSASPTYWRPECVHGPAGVTRASTGSCILAYRLDKDASLVETVGLELRTGPRQRGKAHRMRLHAHNQGPILVRCC
ncbi:hypothetical protein CERSUDRAFT_92437 [Gelatoporia subvermispora B]|uniref:Uncharacterized protein n=1 Tax=Ceriporiopsis subvermispora (strain B) TaxID=914234 RepID=M2R5W7_CERS8|nr:hypothetical protein CERSUDRAFT_92437 [Gelatoporia subvermispora B]